MKNWFDGATSRMKGEMIDSLKQSKLNLESIFRAVKM